MFSEHCHPVLRNFVFAWHRGNSLNGAEPVLCLDYLDAGIQGFSDTLSFAHTLLSLEYAYISQGEL